MQHISNVYQPDLHQPFSGGTVSVSSICRLGLTRSDPFSGTTRRPHTVDTTCRCCASPTLDTWTTAFVADDINRDLLPATFYRRPKPISSSPIPTASPSSSISGGLFAGPEYPGFDCAVMNLSQPREEALNPRPATTTLLGLDQFVLIMGFAPTSSPSSSSLSIPKLTRSSSSLQACVSHMLFSGSSDDGSRPPVTVFSGTDVLLLPYYYNVGLTFELLLSRLVSTFSPPFGKRGFVLTRVFTKTLTSFFSDKERRPSSFLERAFQSSAFMALALAMRAIYDHSLVLGLKKANLKPSSLLISTKQSLEDWILVVDLLEFDGVVYSVSDNICRSSNVVSVSIGVAPLAISKEDTIKTCNSFKTIMLLFYLCFSFVVVVVISDPPSWVWNNFSLLECNHY